MSASKVEQIAAAYEAGATVRQVAAQFGAHHDTVYRALKRRQVQLRPR